MRTLAIESGYHIYKSDISITDIVLSPGIKRHELLNLSHNIHNEIDIFFKFTTHKTIKIACTGSFGKSTTVSLIAHTLNENNIPARAVGNLGITLDNLKEDEIPILELSSLQLETIKTKFDIGIILNIKEHHLNLYKSYDEYYKTKCNLGALSSTLFLEESVKCTHDNKQIISLDNKQADYALINQVFYENGIKICESSYQTLPFLTAYSICRKLNIQSKDIIKAFANFKSLQHRQELVSKNPIIINDSKSTSLECSHFILKQYTNSFWIVGGVKAKIDYNVLKHITKYIKHAFIIGENQDELLKFFTQNNIPFSTYKVLEDVIQKIKYIHQNEAIIFSPGFQSFDQYKNFEERGIHFKDLIKKYF